MSVDGWSPARRKTYEEGVAWRNDPARKREAFVRARWQIYLAKILRETHPRIYRKLQRQAEERAGQAYDARADVEDRYSYDLDTQPPTVE